MRLLPVLLLLLAGATVRLARAADDPFLSGAPMNHSYNIDCGGAADFTSAFGRRWLADRFFSAGGGAGMVAEPHRFPQPQERTLRFFPPSSAGKSSCYSLPLPPGRYYLRLFSVYDNYDSKLRSPSFDVSAAATLVLSFRSPWPEPAARYGAYSDLIFPSATSPTSDVCFYSLSTDAPVVASIEVAPVHPLAYDGATTGANLILVNYGRITCGNSLFGPGFTKDPDAFSRVWQADVDFRNNDLNYDAITAGGRKIFGSNQPPNYFPTKLYESAVTTGGDAANEIEYVMPVDTRLSYMVWLHFAEIDAGIGSAGQRVFDVMVAGKNVTRIDIFKQVGGFTAFKWTYIVENLTSSTMSVKLVPVVGRPILCGLENYAMVPLEMRTVPSQVAAMKALKESLKIPARMSWNGDPCAPTTWDAWEGVTCHHGDKGLVITQLNLSYNSLTGSLPPGLGQPSLVSLDLSSNEFTGSIPGTIGSSKLRIVLLDNNQLDGQVPERLYSIGVHGGVIDLSGNKGLCGVPTLPACALFWEKGGLNKTGKIALGASFGFLLLVILIVVYILCIRRGPYDYDFEFPQDLTSISAISAKRNRYQRAKSVMLAEMEAHSPDGFYTNGSTH
ncbi:receptor-like protein 4 isoform X2 [Phragmites australis]|uniref:receptor-like protein 4 isoform X2 n=1 Tax=Phragmites australis TaxID=29695 RepID=UPI002D771551|nr:receptor-like protein 4 isoform X2 [Phragmites australis]